MKEREEEGGAEGQARGRAEVTQRSQTDFPAASEEPSRREETDSVAVAPLQKENHFLLLRDMKQEVEKTDRNQQQKQQLFVFFRFLHAFLNVPHFC